MEYGLCLFSFRVDSHSTNNSNNDLYYGIGYDSSPNNRINSFVAGINVVDDGSGQLKLSAYNNDEMTDSTSGTYDYGKWYHVALSIDHDANTYSVYVVEDLGGQTPPASNADYGNAILSGLRFNSNSDIDNAGDKTLSTFMVLADDISSTLLNFNNL